MSAAVVTHLVILAQFQSVENDSTATSECSSMSNRSEAFLFREANITEFSEG